MQQDSQNTNPLRQTTNTDTTVELEKPRSGRVRKVLYRILFLLALNILLGAIVWHYSLFSTQREFVLLTTESNLVSVDGGEIEYQRLLVRNRYPFVLSVTTRLCRVGGDEKSPIFTILDTRYFAFQGVRSWYSGTMETHLTFVASDQGQLTVTDQSGAPTERLKMPSSDVDAADPDAWSGSTRLPGPLDNLLAKTLREGSLPGISEIREDRKVNNRDILWYCSLPGDDDDKVLVITLRLRTHDTQGR
ncbi:MAG: hypothetical protein FWD31_11460 [Planctomycetaceae bacterium]|nr:hypothetical protein [Planctomycetaceae bacterium]